MYYLMSMAVGTVGAAYAAVPLYRAFCQSTGYGGTVKEVNLISILVRFKYKTKLLILNKKRELGITNKGPLKFF